MNNDLVTIVLDKPRTIKFRNKAVKMLEGMFKCRMQQIIEKLPSMNMDELIKVLHTGLSWEDDTLTLVKLDDLLDEHVSIYEIYDKLGEAIRLAFTGSKNVPGTVAEEVPVNSISTGTNTSEPLSE